MSDESTTDHVVMTEQERIAILERHVRQLAGIVGQILYHVTIRGNVPFDTNDRLVEGLNEIDPNPEVL
jgi:hypothetical protein